jgi:glycosyltransferase involved in cell wall biosynthesis
MAPMGGDVHVAVDGSGLARPTAGVGIYTRQILRALAALPEGPSGLSVFAPAGAALDVPGTALRPLPSLPLVGRHVAWPLELRRLGAAGGSGGRPPTSWLFLGCAGQLPLGGVGMPSVVTVHDLAIYRHPEWFPGRQWLSTRVVVPRSLRRASALVCVSANTAADVAELFEVPPERLHVVPEGVDAAFRPLPDEQLRESRARLELPDRFVLFVSTLEPRKNVKTLLDAWSRLPDRPALVLAGGWGWRTDDLRARLERAPAGVHLLQSVAPGDLPVLYNLASCLAHPAWYEGFGLTPLEAMACGTPVVVSSRSSLPEVVGDAGVLVDPADVEGWTEALGGLLADPGRRDQLRERGLRRAAELTWERSAEQTWAVMRQLLGDGAPA